MTIKDLSAYLQVPITTIYGWNSDGTGPPYRRIGRHVRYRLVDVDRWLDRDQLSG